MPHARRADARCGGRDAALRECVRVGQGNLGQGNGGKGMGAKESRPKISHHAFLNLSALFPCPHSFASIPLPHPPPAERANPNCAFDRLRRARYLPARENVRRPPLEPRDRRLAGGARGAGRVGGGRVRLHGAGQRLLLRQPCLTRDFPRGSADDPLGVQQLAASSLCPSAVHRRRLRAGCWWPSFLSFACLPRALGRSDFPSGLRPAALIRFLSKPVVCPDAVRQGVVCLGVETDWLCELSPWSFLYWRCRCLAVRRRRSVCPRRRRVPHRAGRNRCPSPPR